MAGAKDGVRKAGPSMRDLVLQEFKLDTQNKLLKGAVSYSMYYARVVVEA